MIFFWGPVRENSVSSSLSGGRVEDTVAKVYSSLTSAAPSSKLEE